MNQRQNDRFKMLKACLNKVNAFASVWATNVVFANLVSLLQGYITDLITNDVQQTTDTLGVTQSKNLKRQVLTDLIMDGAKAGMGYAASIHDVQLKAGCKLVESDLKKLSDVDLVAAGQNMYNLLNPVSAALGNWGVTAATMSSLQNAIADLTAAVSQFESVRAGITLATQNIPQLTNDAITFLEEQMDSAMRQYKTSHADFHDEYFIARGINTHGHRTKVSIAVRVHTTGNSVLALAEVLMEANGGAKRSKHTLLACECKE